MHVILYNDGGRRSRTVAESLKRGVERAGWRATMTNRFEGVIGDVAMAYGWINKSIFHAYEQAGAQYVYWDLGFWERRLPGGTCEGYHRHAVNSWDTCDHMHGACPDDRLALLDIDVSPENKTKGADILIAGMSRKAAAICGYEFEEWEIKMATEVRKYSRKPIVIRQKPSKEFPPPCTMTEALNNAWILLSHHSNAAFEAIAMGVPVWSEYGLGRMACPLPLSERVIKFPLRLSLSERKGFLADAAYAQWRLSEMRSGAAIESIKGLLK